MKFKFLMFALVVAFAATVNAQEVTEKEVKCEKCENAAAGPKAAVKGAGAKEAVKVAGPKAAGAKAVSGMSSWHPISRRLITS